MRTTVDIKKEHREKLQELARREGHRGISDLVNEALEEYLRIRWWDEERRRAALRLEGTLSPNQGEAFRRRVKRLRSLPWR